MRDLYVFLDENDSVWILFIIQWKRIVSIVNCSICPVGFILLFIGIFLFCWCKFGSYFGKYRLGMLHKVWVSEISSIDIDTQHKGKETFIQNTLWSHTPFLGVQTGFNLVNSSEYFSRWSCNACWVEWSTVAR
jgi:hypothetical protein